MKGSRIISLVICLCLLSVLCATSVAQASLTSQFDDDSIFRAIQVGSAAVATGQEQQLHVTLKQSTDSTVLHQLVITYADGATQDAYAQSDASDVTLSWVVPPTARPGTAFFTLSSSACGCGDRARPASPIKVMSKADGQFLVTSIRYAD